MGIRTPIKGLKSSPWLVCAAALLVACNLPPTQPGGTPTARPTVTPTGTATPGPGPSPVAPAGAVKLIQGARCEPGSVWVLPKDEEIAVAPCPPPESQPAYVVPAPTRQIPADQYEQLKERYGAFSVRPAPKLLGSLEPAVALADSEMASCGAGGGVVFHGGLLGLCSRYIVADNDAYRLLQDAADFQAYFAPITTAAEAASYAIARSGASWKSSFPELKDSFRFYTRLLRRSYVEESNGSYEVLLYDLAQFGCGPHPYYALTYRVSRDGTLTELSRQMAWADPLLDNLCVD